MKDNNISLYRHYKNKPYKHLGEALHSETLEPMVLYETRYENECGSLWVRPKEMFFGIVVVNGEEVPRFQKVDTQVKVSEEISNQELESIAGLLDQVFGDYKVEQLGSKLKDKTGLLLVSAYDGSELVGFKLGFEQSKDNFYSWLGGVHPDYHGIGLGRLLMEEQHRWCTEHGYKKITTKTMNKWKSMLILNLKSGFSISGTEETPSGDLKILLEKSLD